MKIAVISANLGGFEPLHDYAEQSVPYDFFRIDDKWYPPRSKSMTPRLQARIVKMFMWQFAPGYDYYIWVDSSCILSHENSVKWFLAQLGSADIAVFKHPHRKTVREEADYLIERLELERSGKKQKYILPRYENEDIIGQLRAVDPQAELFASTAFIYKDSAFVRLAMKEWAHHVFRYHSIDQLSLPYALGDLRVNVIQDHYLHTPYLEHVRKK